MEQKKPQLFFIHGGTTFSQKKDYLSFLQARNVSIEERISWSDDYLKRELGDLFQIIHPRMPCKENAKYAEWKIHFERYFWEFQDNIILIGCSLGGIFLAKYLSENVFPKKIRATYLICPPFDNTLPREEVVGGFHLKSDLSLLEKNSTKLYLLFSRSDDVVPVEHAEKYARKLKNANIIVYETIQWHFRIQEFPEIIALIKEELRK